MASVMTAFKLRRRVGLAMLAYLLLEIYRYHRLKRQSQALARTRTPLSASFDAAAWGAFFSSVIEREGKHAPERLEHFISSVFWRASVRSLPQAAVEAWLRMFLTAKEDVDRTESEWRRAQSLARATRKRIEAALGYEFGEKEGHAPFIRINHPKLQNTPATPLPQPLPMALSRWLLRRAGSGALHLLGFMRSTDHPSGLTFWTRDMHAGDVEPLRVAPNALLVAPGLGLGAVPYVPFLTRLLCSSRLAAAYRTIVVLEPPGLSGLPSVGGPSCAGVPTGESPPAFPTAEAVALAVRRHVRERLGLQHIDGLGHSFGGLLLTYVELYQPDVLGRVMYFDCPNIVAHTTFFWPKLFAPLSCASVARAAASGDLRGAAWPLCSGELWHQHVIHNATWFMEYCHREHTLDDRRLFLLSGRDDVVDSFAVRDYLARFHPKVRVHLIEHWSHGDGVVPGRWETTLSVLEDFFAGADGEQAIVADTDAGDEAPADPLCVDAYPVRVSASHA